MLRRSPGVSNLTKLSLSNLHGKSSTASPMFTASISSAPSPSSMGGNVNSYNSNADDENWNPLLNLDRARRMRAAFEADKAIQDAKEAAAAAVKKGGYRRKKLRKTRRHRRNRRHTRRRR